ncbi:MAG TPA: HEAT repeat domain-containing protein [Chloroflexia bacterium]|nr:HEAT repeat domain-containing protein [Chloroflexia bacterium]
MSLEQTLNELRYGGPEVRIRAAINLAQANNPQVTPYLIDALHDEEPEVRVAISRALITYRDPRSVPALISLLKDKNFVVTEAAATTLGLIGDPAAGKPLLDLMERAKAFGPNTYPQHQSVVQAIVALGRIKDPHATGAMIKMLKKGYKNSVSDWLLQVRQAAALGLGMLDQPAGTEALIETLREDERPEVRASATTALGMLRSENSFRQMVANLSMSTFENQARLWRRQEGIVIALGQRGDREAVPYLLPLVHSPYPEVRIALAETMVRLGETEKGEILIQLLRDRSPDVRHAAAQALGQLGIQAAAGPLSAVAVDPDRRVAIAALTALENIKALPSAPTAGPTAYLPTANPQPPDENSGS